MTKLTATGVEKGHCLVAAAGGEVMLLEHGDYRGSIPADGGTPITCLLALTKVSVVGSVCAATTLVSGTGTTAAVQFPPTAACR